MHTNHHPPTRPGCGIGKGDSGIGRVEAHRIFIHTASEVKSHGTMSMDHARRSSSDSDHRNALPPVHNPTSSGNQLGPKGSQLGDPNPNQDWVVGPTELKGVCLSLLGLHLWLFSFFCFPPGISPHATPLVSVDFGRKTGLRRLWPEKLGFDRKSWFWSILADKCGYGRFWVILGHWGVS